MSFYEESTSLRWQTTLFENRLSQIWLFWRVSAVFPLDVKMYLVDVKSLDSKQRIRLAVCDWLKLRRLDLFHWPCAKGQHFEILWLFKFLTNVRPLIPAGHAVHAVTAVTAVPAELWNCLVSSHISTVRLIKTQFLRQLDLTAEALVRRRYTQHTTSFLWPSLYPISDWRIVSELIVHCSINPFTRLKYIEIHWRFLLRSVRCSREEFH